MGEELPKLHEALGKGGGAMTKSSVIFCVRSSMRYPLVIPLPIFYLVLNREESGGVEGLKKDVYISSKSPEDKIFQPVVEASVNVRLISRSLVASHCGNVF